LALGKDVQHLPADIAGSTDDGDVIGHGWACMVGPWLTFPVRFEAQGQ
jgi:hypothetical protein